MLLEYNSSCKISYFIGGELLIDDKRLYCPPFLPTPHFKKKKKPYPSSLSTYPTPSPIHIYHPIHIFQPPHPYTPSLGPIHIYQPIHITSVIHILQPPSISLTPTHLCLPHPPSFTTSMLYQAEEVQAPVLKKFPPPPISPNLPLGWNHHSPLKAIPNKQ